MVKHLTTQESQVRPLSQVDPLEEEITTHSGILAWEILWTQEPGELQSTESQKSWTRLSEWTTATTQEVPLAKSNGHTGESSLSLGLLISSERQGAFVQPQPQFRTPSFRSSPTPRIS